MSALVSLRALYIINQRLDCIFSPEARKHTEEAWPCPRVIVAYHGAESFTDGANQTVFHNTMVNLSFSIA